MHSPVGVGCVDSFYTHAIAHRAGAATRSPVGGGGCINAFHTRAIAYGAGAATHSPVGCGCVNVLHTHMIAYRAGAASGALCTPLLVVAALMRFIHMRL